MLNDHLAYIGFYTWGFVMMALVLMGWFSHGRLAALAHGIAQQGTGWKGATAAFLTLVLVSMLGIGITMSPWVALAIVVAVSPSLLHWVLSGPTTVAATSETSDA